MFKQSNKQVVYKPLDFQKFSHIAGTSSYQNTNTYNLVAFFSTPNLQFDYKVNSYNIDLPRFSEITYKNFYYNSMQES